ncbi:MAG: type II secretion system F family protein [Candidatus Aenigmatarchaeota archaeon]
MSYRGIATYFFGSIVEKYSKYFLIVKDSLVKADIKIPFKSYMSTVFLTSLIVYILSLPTTLFALTFFKIPTLMKLIYLIFVPFLAAVVCFIVLVFYPYQKAITRRKNIEINLPFVLTHMGAIAESGAPPYILFKLIGEFEEYGEISKEMKKIVKNIETFGVDPITAAKRVAEKTPSDSFKQLLLGFISTVKSGGDTRLFLKNAGQQALFEWRVKRERFLQQLSAYAEFYTGILIAAPLFIIALFAIMNMIQPTLGGYAILDLMKLSIYLIVPMVNVGFIVFLRGMEVEM